MSLATAWREHPAFQQSPRDGIIAEAIEAAARRLTIRQAPHAPPGIEPQPGPQTQFYRCQADIAFLGGSVYGGKTWSLTFEPTKHTDNPGFNAVTFRRTKPDIRNPGSIWDESMKMYPLFDAEPRVQALDWAFPSGSITKFDGLQYESDVLSWKGAQIALLQFDQVEEFTEHQFWYMQSRNRSTSGVKPYTRATCNALADTWVAGFIQWWWDPETGYVIDERSNITRWFVRVDDEVHWASVTCRGDAPAAEFARAHKRAVAEIEGRFAGKGDDALSFCFIRAKITDNRIGVKLDPRYEARVRSLSLVEQERLLGGNWKIRAAAGLVFDRSWFDLVGAAPLQVKRRVRYWDKAATAGGGDWTVGTLMSEGYDGIFYIEDVERGQWGSGEREKVIKQHAMTDPEGTEVGVEQEPGSGGKDSAVLTVINLAGYATRRDRPTGDLVLRAQPLAAQAQVRNVKLVRGVWNETWLREVHAFPTKGLPDDQVASVSGAFKHITRPIVPRRSGLGSRSIIGG